MNKGFIFGFLSALLLIFIVGVAYEMGVQDTNQEIVQNNDSNEKAGVYSINESEIKNVEENTGSYHISPDFSQVSSITEGLGYPISFESHSVNLKCYFDMLIVDANLNYQFPWTCNVDKNSISVEMPQGYMNQLAQQGLTPLKLVAVYNFTNYGVDYSTEEFEI